MGGWVCFLKALANVCRLLMGILIIGFDGFLLFGGWIMAGVNSFTFDAISAGMDDF